MPKEYYDILESLQKAHPNWSEGKLKEMAARTFASIFGTNPQHAEELMKQGKWEEYKKSHSKKDGGKCVDTLELFTNGVELKEEPDGDYVEGFVSTPELDLGNDVVDCQKQIVEQLNSGDAMATKLSYRHDWLKTQDRDSIPPFGKAVIAELRFNQKSLTDCAWARYRLNKGYPDYEAKKKEIKEGFSDSFSIEYKVIDTVVKQFGNISARVIRSLRLLGAAIAARPMNSSAVVTGFMLKEFEYNGEINGGVANSSFDYEMKEVWTAAYVNDLSDECFAYISPGGKKDEEGKTIPRSLRHLPYKNKEGQPDAAHVRNALARLPQTDISVGAKMAARKKLVAAARKLGIEVGGEDEKEVDSMEGTETKEIDQLKKELQEKEAKLSELQKVVQMKEVFETELKELRAKEKLLINQKEAEAKEAKDRLAAETKEYFEKKGSKWSEASELIKKLGVW